MLEAERVFVDHDRVFSDRLAEAAAHPFRRDMRGHRILLGLCACPRPPRGAPLGQFASPCGNGRIVCLKTHFERALQSAQRRRRAGGDREIGGKTADRISREDRKSTRLNSSHVEISYAVFCLKKKKK